MKKHAPTGFKEELAQAIMALAKFCCRDNRFSVNAAGLFTKEDDRFCLVPSRQPLPADNLYIGLNVPVGKETQGDDLAMDLARDLSRMIKLDNLPPDKFFTAEYVGNGRIYVSLPPLIHHPAKMLDTFGGLSRRRFICQGMLAVIGSVLSIDGISRAKRNKEDPLQKTIGFGETIAGCAALASPASRVIGEGVKRTREIDPGQENPEERMQHFEYAIYRQIGAELADTEIRHGIGLPR